MTIEKKVEKWAIRLDVHDPEWYLRVNRSINLRNDRTCVIGQAFGHFHESEEAICFRRTWFPLWRFRVCSFTPRPFCYFKLGNEKRARKAWEREVEKRCDKPPFDQRSRFLQKRTWHTPTLTAERESERV